MGGPRRAPDTCSRHARPHAANKQTCPYRWNSINVGAPSPGSLTVAAVNCKANAASSAIFPHAETANYTKGLTLLHVPGMLTPCFMASALKKPGQRSNCHAPRFLRSSSIHHVHSEREQRRGAARRIPISRRRICPPDHRLSWVALRSDLGLSSRKSFRQPRHLGREARDGRKSLGHFIPC